MGTADLYKAINKEQTAMINMPGNALYIII